MIAKVIVDVPLMQTDKPYSYQIPSEFEDMVEAGMRVHVPFGKGNRLIQGIVVDVVEEGDTLSLLYISQPTRLKRITYCVFCFKKKKKQ